MALVWVALLFAWTTFRAAGVDPADYNITALGLAILYALLLRHPQAPRLEPWLAWPLILLCFWVLFQIVPLPPVAVRLLAPARARLAAPFSGWIPLSAFPAATLGEWMHLAGCFLLFLIVRELGWRFSDRSDPWVVVLPLVAAASLEALLGVVQFYTGAAAEGAHGTYANRDHFAGLLEMALPFPVMYGLAALNGRRSRHASPLIPALVACGAFTVAALLLVGAIVSLSRMGFICALFALAVPGAAAIPRKRWLLAVPAAILLLFLYLPPNELIARFADVATPDQLSAQDRLQVWRETLPLVSDYFLAGCGLGAFESVFMRYKRSTPLIMDNYVHNDYLQYFAELGIPGFLFGLTLVVVVMVRAARAASHHSSPAGRALALACLASLSALLLHSTVDFNSYIAANALAFSWISALAVSAHFSLQPQTRAATVVLDRGPN